MVILFDCALKFLYMNFYLIFLVQVLYSRTMIPYTMAVHGTLSSSTS